MPIGHQIDAATVALWRFNTITDPGVVAGAADDSGNGWDYVQGHSDVTVIQGGPGGVTLGENSLGAEVVDDADLCTWVHPGNNYLIVSNPGTSFANNILASTWTFTGRVYVESYGAGTYQIVWRFANLAGGTGSGNNELLVRINNATQRLQFFWQHGSKVNASVDQSSGSIPVRTWTHVAARVVYNAGDWTVTLYVDGVEVGSGTDTAPALGEYANADIVIGRNFDSSDRFHGGIANIALSDIDRGASYIATEAAQSDSRVTADGNHFGIWNFQEVPAAYDHGPNGLHLVAANNSSNVDIGGIFSVLGEGGFGRYSPFSANAGMRCPKRQVLYDTLIGGEHTLEMWHRMNPNLSSANDVGLISYGTSGEAQTDNYLMSLSVDRTTVVPVLTWENGAGVDVVGTGNNAWWTLDDQDEMSLKHLAFVVTDAGGGQSEGLYYRDGVQVGTVAAQNDPDGGDNESAFLFIARDEIASLSALGMYDDIRLSNVARPQAQIQEAFDSGIATDCPDPNTAITVRAPQLALPVSEKQNALETLLPGATTAYVGLFTSMPEADGTGGTEATGSGYARVGHNSWKTVTVEHVVKRQNSGTVQFSALTGDLTVRGWGIWDAASGGNLLGFGRLRGPGGEPLVVELQSGDEPQFLSGELFVGLQ